MDEIKITILSENNVSKNNLLAEHGLSFLIEHKNQTILFDTGQGMVLEHNAIHLGYNLSNINSIILSHGHYDHSGCLRNLTCSMRQGNIYLHPEAIEKKYIKKMDHTVKEISIPWFDQEYLKKKGFKINWTKEPAQIMKNIFVTGEIVKNTHLENTENCFFKDKEASKKDELKDDQAVFLKTQKGIVVLLGCAHSGVINTLEYICKITKSHNIHAVIGGMHLKKASQEKLKNIVSIFNKLNIDIIAPGHCSGLKAKAYIFNHFKGIYKELEVGSTFTFLYKNK